MTSLFGAVAKTAWDLVYCVSPIILTGGIASSLSSSFSTSGLLGPILSSITSQGIPIAAILDPISLLSDPVGLVSGQTLNTESLFAHFTPMPGGTLLDFESAKFAFANQSTAANAMIQRETNISLFMECAYRGHGGMVSRIAALQAMQATITKHVVQGGQFTVLTPGMVYSNALLLRITDVSQDPTKPQTAFQWDFEKPLITTTDAAGASSTMMSKLTGGQQTNGAWVQPASTNADAPQLGGLY